MDPITITIAAALGALYFFSKKKTKRGSAPGGLTILTVTNSTPPIIKEAAGTVAAVSTSANVVLSLPSDWRGTASFQGVIWEEQGNPDGPDFMFRRDPVWDGESYFKVAVRNSYGQHVGNVSVKLGE